jgi:putative transposase
MSSATFYKWRAKYGGMDALMISEMKSLEDENRRLKKMFAELSMQNDLLKGALGKNNPAIPAPGDGRGCSGATGHFDCLGVSHFRVERDLLSLQPEALRRERPDRGPAGGFDGSAENLGVWALFSVLAQCSGPWLEPQTGLSDLPGAGTEPAHQAQEAVET